MSTPDRLTLTQTCQLFGITSMSLYLWRKGTAKRAPLPAEKPRAKLGESPNSVLFDPAKVVKWADKHDVPMAMTVSQALRTASADAAPKRGPKPRKVEAKAPAKTIKAPAKAVAKRRPAAQAAAAA